jgi:uncharacterized membrane protein
MPQLQLRPETWRRSVPIAVAVATLLALKPVRSFLGIRRRDDTRRALGGPRGVRLEEAVSVASTPEELYARWRALEHLPEVIPHLERVEVLDDRRSRWTARGRGIRVTWDAEIITDIEPHTIAWRSLPGSDVATAGSVRFLRQERGGTTLVVTLQYDPPGGKAGAWLAAILGRSPERDLREGLRAFKQLVEAGERPTTEGQPSGRRGQFSGLLGAS